MTAVSVQAADATDTGGPPPRRPLVDASVIAAVVFAAAAAVSTAGWRPPTAADADASAAEFAATRAAAHVAIVAMHPRPMGSPQWTRTREYILQQLSGLSIAARVERATVFSRSRVVHVHNVVATVPGVTRSPGVLVSAHYDSVPNSPGAADNGAGVAVLLEIGRALRARGALARDVTLLFSDGEELGLSGAAAFSASRTLREAFRVAINLDARGSRGPALMFETGPGTVPLMDGFAEAVPRPVATSLMPELYRLVDNDTDFSVFTRAGVPGFNFAFVDGAVHYHTGADTLAKLDMRSLQHMGDSALALTRRFAEAETTGTADEQIYFNIGPLLVRYSSTWVATVSVVALVASVLAAGFGIRRRRMSIRGLLLGAAALPVCAMAAILLTTLIWILVLLVHPHYGLMPYGDTYNSALYRVALSAVALACAAAAYGWLMRRTAVENLWAAVLLTAGAAAGGLAVVAPGASYLFAWPALTGAAGLIAIISRGWPLVSRAGALAAVPCALAVWLLFLPVVTLFYGIFSAAFFGPAAVVLVVTVALLLPQYAVLWAWHRTAPAACAAAVGAACVLAGAQTSHPSASAPVPSMLSYTAEPAARTASWVTTSRALDEWQLHVMGTPGRRQRCDESLLARAAECLSSPAPYVAFAAPAVDFMEERLDAEWRVLRFRVRSPRNAPVIQLGFDREVELIRATTADTPGVAARGAAAVVSTITLVAPPSAGTELLCRVKGRAAIHIRVSDRSYGLDGLPGFVPRPADRIPGGRYSDAVIVLSALTL